MRSAIPSIQLAARSCIGCLLAIWLPLLGTLGCGPNAQIVADKGFGEFADPQQDLGEVVEASPPPQEDLTLFIVPLTDSSSTAQQRLEAAIGLVESDEPAAAEALAQILIAEPPTPATLAVAEAMGVAEKPPPPLLLVPAIAALNSESPQVRDAVGEALRRFAQDGVDSANIEALLSANRELSMHLSKMEGESDSLARRLAAALRQVFNLTEEAPSQQRTDLLLGWMSRGETVERELAVRLVSEFIVGTSRPVPEVLIEPLTAMIADPQPAVRLAVAEIFRDLATEQSAAPLLRQLLFETEPEVQAAQAAALGKIGSLASVEPLVRLLRAGDEARQAALALGRLARRRLTADGRPAPLQAPQKRALRALIEAFESLSNIPADQIKDVRAHLELREAVVDALAEVGDPAVLPTLLRASDDAAAKVRFAAASGLGQFDTTKSIDALTRRLNDPDRGVRLTAATALGQSSQERVAEIIYRQLKREDDAAVSDALWKVLLSQIDGLQEAGQVQQWVERIKPAAKSGHAKALRRSGEVMSIWIDRLDQEKDRQARLDALLELADIRLSLDQPLEAAARIHEASALVDGDRQDFRAQLAARRCSALLKGGNVAGVAASVTEQLEPMTAEHRSVVFKAILAHEQDLIARNAHRQALATVNQLYPALTTLLDENWRQQMLKARARAEKGWQQQLQRQVRMELDRLLNPRASDEEASKVAQNLREMSDDALQEVVKQWFDRLAGKALAENAEKRLVEIVGQWDPKLTGYDTSADVDARRETLQKWLTQIQPKDDG